MDLIYHGYKEIGGHFFLFPFLHSWFLRPSGTALLVIRTCRACPSLVPRKTDLKKLLDGPSRNFWYGIEEDKYLEASVLGSDMVTIKKFVGATGTRQEGSLNPHI